MRLCASAVMASLTAANDCPWASLSVAAIAAVAEPQPPVEQSASAPPAEGLWPALAALQGYQGG